ncbi:sialin-like [Biomphalaria glabrata]|uniref:Sialin-like n=1 Tax=Biomphalaria glabrata TaxID=6526 RepID=A0A9W2YM99_BIOGL|nr:sialin-like [Biomphalaria glabrata]XP_055863832.1 sialin-like [Biomphalaria glabrata]XP_055863841.1 sialin-like [Biomphalaria glabrata]
MRPSIIKDPGETKIADLSEMNTSGSRVHCSLGLEGIQTSRHNSLSSLQLCEQLCDILPLSEHSRLTFPKDDKIIQTDNYVGSNSLFKAKAFEDLGIESIYENEDYFFNGNIYEDINCTTKHLDRGDSSLSRTMTCYSERLPCVSQIKSLPLCVQQTTPPDSGVCSESTSTLTQMNNTSDCDSYCNSDDAVSEKISALLNNPQEQALTARIQSDEILCSNCECVSCNSLNTELACTSHNVTTCTENISPEPDQRTSTSTTVSGTDELLLHVVAKLASRQNCLREKENPQSNGVSEQPRKSDKDSSKRNKYTKLKRSRGVPKESFLSKYTSCRWVLAYMCFMGRFVQTALRQCMGVAVLGMTMRRTFLVEEMYNATMDTTTPTNWSETYNESIDSYNQTFEAYNQREVLINKTYTEQEMSWDSIFEGVLLTSFNAGSIITPILVGYLTTRYGGRNLMTFCLLCGGVFTVLLPVTARAHPSLIIALRLITGVALSGSDSLIQAMWAKWAPRYELASLTSCSYSGLSVAGVLTFLISGYLVSIGGHGRGWPYIFYVFGSLCLLLAPIWWLTVYDSPESHPRITKKELAIITFTKQPEVFHDKQPLKTPWMRIIKSPAVWVILMGHISNKWILSFMLSYLPRYFSDFFAFDLETDGLFSSLPFVGRIVSGLVTGYLSDWLLLRGLSVCKTRKLFQGIGCFGCALFSLFIALIPTLTTGWSISLLVLALSFQNVTSVAFRINLLDIAPRYAGLLNGVVSTIATVISLPAPVLTSLMIAGGSRDGWTIVFCLVAAFNFIGGLIFVIFAEGDVQDWAKSDYASLSSVTVDVPEVHRPTDSQLEVSVTDSSAQVDPKELQLPVPSQSKFKVKPLREVKSVPCSMRRGSKIAKVKVGRRATLDEGSLFKRLQNQAFSNLALADL